MSEHEQTTYVGGDPDERRKNELRGESLLFLWSQSAERERERGLILTLRKQKTNEKTNLNVKRSRNKKSSWR